MRHKLDILSYTLAAIAGLCFANSVAVLSGGRER